MKVRFNVNNGANVHSCRSQVFDTKKDLGLPDGEWERLTEEERWDMVKGWADNHIEIYYEELD